MTQSLFTGASGLLAHQRKLDVVANNLANLNTTSYKSQSIQFADLLYDTIQSASGPAGLFSGGTNSKQIGQGVNVSQVTKDFTQGILANTGKSFDFAIQGDGFFIVSSDSPKFTRDGAFAVDANGYLVDPSTGDYVQRFGNIGESFNAGASTGFQSPGDTRIFVPLGASVPGGATTNFSFQGNLPASADPPTTEVLVSAFPLETGGSPADASTALNDLNNNLVDYTAGDIILIEGTNADGSAFSANFTFGTDGTTVGDLVTAIGNQLTDSSIAIVDGNLQITADAAGAADLSLSIQDDGASTGETDWDQHFLIAQTTGLDGGTFESVIQVYDSLGESHPITATFEKITASEWTATFSSPDTNGSVQFTDGLVSNIRFNEDGSFQTVGGTGLGDANIEVTIDGLTQPLVVSIALDGMSHVNSAFNATPQQDGFPPGNIISISASTDGVLTGIATNGEQVDFAQLAIAKFANNSGLESVGQNYYQQTTNSGLPVVGAAETYGVGEVRGGQLENSNVDIALEFTQLIVAQRGFSANARTITVASEVLQELNNIL
jgi:flagellar hook protein FlgE